MDERLGIEAYESPMDQLEAVDLELELAALDEEMTMFDPETHPRDHRKGDPDEPVCDCGGKSVDVMADTPNVDGLAVFDLSDLELAEFDVRL